MCLPRLRRIMSKTISSDQIFFTSLHLRTKVNDSFVYLTKMTLKRSSRASKWKKPYEIWSYEQQLSWFEVVRYFGAAAAQYVPSIQSITVQSVVPHRSIAPLLEPPMDPYIPNG